LTPPRGGDLPGARRTPVVAVFFETDGAVVVDPDGAGPFFEVPIVGPLPEGVNF
jgi:hypothetical protein